MANARTLPADVHPETLSRLQPVQRAKSSEAQQKLYDALTAPRSVLVVVGQELHDHHQPGLPE